MQRWIKRLPAFGLFAVLLCAAGALATGAPDGALAGDQETLALTNVTVIDGNGGPPLANMTVVISGERIVDLFGSRKERVPPGAHVMDMAGQYLIPGLIDSHVHLISGPPDKVAAARLLRFALLGGITSVRDMAGDAIALKEAAGAALGREVAAPHIYFSALMAGPTFFQDPRARASAHGAVPGEAAWLRAITPETDIAAAVAAAKATGATGIKIYADLPGSLVAKITAEAHRQGLRVWSHATIFPAGPGDAVAAGVDVISHSAYLIWEGIRPIPDSYRNRLTADYDLVRFDSEPITKLLMQMRARKTVLDATLFVFDSQARSPQAPPGVRDMQKLLKWSIAVTKRAHEVGVRVVAGTDSIGTPEKQAVPNIHDEIELFVRECGFTPLEAITTATRTGAEVLGIERDYGTIAVGKTADLVALADDPYREIRSTRRILWVMKAGKIYNRDQTMR